MGSQRSDRGTRIARWSGLSAGLAVVIVALYAWQVPPSPGPLPGANVMFIAGPTGELEVSPTGRFLAGTDLRPAGRVITGMLSIRNQTGRKLDVQLRALPNLDDLDHLLQVEVSGSEGVLFRGDLGGLRAWTDPLTLRRGRAQSLSFRAWMASGAPSGYEGDDASVTMEFLSTPVGG
jgi:hypothetical protein